MHTLALNDLVRDVLHLVGSDASRRGIALQTELHEALPLVRGDRVQLQQALLNLILNGMEAVEQATDGDRRIVVRTARADGTSVDLVVADTGPGIPAQQIPQVFESFFTTKKDGMGLGLSIVRSIAEAHGGSVEAGSNGGRGAVFRLRLPGIPLASASPPEV
jgi:signal transduction histidine kinase